METNVKKSNTQLLREIQDVVDELNLKKSEVESLLQVIDSLEVRYYNLVEEVKNNSKK